MTTHPIPLYIFSDIQIRTFPPSRDIRDSYVALAGDRRTGAFNFPDHSPIMESAAPFSLRGMTNSTRLTSSITPIFLPPPTPRGLEYLAY